MTRHRFRDRLAHGAPLLLVSTAVTSVLLDVLIGPDWSLYWIASLVTGAAAFIACSSGFGHRERLCTICVGLTPLDGTATANHHRRALNAAHHAGPFIVAALSLFILVSIVIAHTHLDKTWIGEGLVVAPLLALPLIMRSELLHKILRPWCPRCGWFGGPGRDEPATSPDPTWSGAR